MYVLKNIPVDDINVENKHTRYGPSSGKDNVHFYIVGILFRGKQFFTFLIFTSFSAEVDFPSSWFSNPIQILKNFSVKYFSTFYFILVLSMMLYCYTDLLNSLTSVWTPNQEITSSAVSYCRTAVILVSEQVYDFLSDEL